MELVPQITKTKTQLKALGYPFIGIQLKAGGKVFGEVDKFTKYTIYIKDKHGDILDVPRRFIQRSLLMIKGDKDDVGVTVFEKDKPPTR